MDTRPFVRAYNIWRGMRARCGNPKHPAYSKYGARGITVCDRWASDFQAFFDDMGCPQEGQSIDRIDGTKGYFPENCRWATKEEQQNNISSNINITHLGKTQSLGKWARELGINTSTLYDRIVERKMPPEMAFIPEKFTDLSGLALGGAASGAKNRAKTHCKWGHEFTAENTMPNGPNGRACRACHNARQRVRHDERITPTRKGAVLITLNGETLSMAQWAVKLGISRNTITRRLNNGLPPEVVLSKVSLPHPFAGKEPPIAEIRRNQTHCKHGHEFTEANTIRLKSGGRHCKECNKIRAREFYRKKAGSPGRKPKAMEHDAI